MTFQLNRRSRNQLKRFSNRYLDNPEIIEREDNNSFSIWGKDPILGTSAAVGVDINQRGKITALNFFSVGQDELRDYDNQYFDLEFKNPNKAFKWFQKVDIATTPILADMTNPQLFADAANEMVPGLAGGPLDVYVSFGDYYAFA